MPTVTVLEISKNPPAVHVTVTLKSVAAVIPGTDSPGFVPLSVVQVLAPAGDDSHVNVRPDAAV
jgi:hypothetical protein